MAIKSTIYKAELEIVDMDRHYYATHKLTLACHSSETEERMMVRLLAFALNAHERLEFGKGISDSDEPDLWQKDLAGEVEVWIELGHPDERAITKACGRAKKVIVYTYSANPERWWDTVKTRLGRERNLWVCHIDADSSQSLSALADRTMNLQCSTQDGEIWMRDDKDRSVQLVTQLRPPALA